MSAKGCSICVVLFLSATGFSYAADSKIDIKGFVNLDTLFCNYGDCDAGAGTVGGDFRIPETIPVGDESSSSWLAFNKLEKIASGNSGIIERFTISEKIKAGSPKEPILDRSNTRLGD